MTIKAYQRAATQGDSPRELEYRAFGQVTAGLVRAVEETPSGGALAEAVDANRRLWNVLAADCSVARYSADVIRDGAALDPLIDVNRTMMEGLAAR